MAEAVAPATLPATDGSGRSSGWFGMIALIVTEASLFLYLLFTYFYLALFTTGGFVPEPLPKFELATPNTGILLASSVAVWWGERGARQGKRPQLLAGLLATLVLGAVFVSVQLVEWRGKPFHFNQTSYSAIYFTITGFHMAHVIIGMLMLTALLAWSLAGYFDARRSAPITIGAVYWHFVDAVWLVVFFTIYVTPYLGAK